MEELKCKHGRRMVDFCAQCLWDDKGEKMEELKKCPHCGRAEKQELDEGEVESFIFGYYEHNCIDDAMDISKLAKAICEEFNSKKVRLPSRNRKQEVIYGEWDYYEKELKHLNPGVEFEEENQ